MRSFYRLSKLVKESSLYELITHKNFVYLLFGLYFTAQYFLINSFKLSVLLSVLMLVVFYVITRSILAAFFFVTMTHVYILYPLKEYTVLLIADKIKTSDFFTNGVERIYGISNIDLLLMWLTIFFARILYFNFSYQLFVNFFKNKIISVTVVSWLIFFLLNFFNSLNSHFAFFSTISSLLFFKLILLALLFYILLRNKFHYLVKKVLEVTLLFANTVAIGQITSLVSSDQKQSLFRLVEESSLLSRATSLWAHPNHYAISNSLLLLMYLYFIKFKKLTTLEVVTLAFSFLGIILSQTRGVWLAWVVVLFVFATKHWDEIKSFFLLKLTKYINGRSFILALLFFVFSLFVVKERFENTLNYDRDFGFIGIRKIMIEESLELIQMNPFVGAGTELSMNYLYYNNQQGFVSFFPSSPHFQPIEVILESGWASLIPFYLPFVTLLMFKINNKKSVVNITNAGIFLITTYFMLQNGSGYETIGMFMGIAAYEYETKI